MILARITRAIREQNWFAVVLEFVFPVQAGPAFGDHPELPVGPERRQALREIQRGVDRAQSRGPAVRQHALIVRGRGEVAVRNHARIFPYDLDTFVERRQLRVLLAD